MACLLFVSISCDDFGDLNVNPNASETPVTSALLTNVLTGLGGSTSGGTSFVAGLYCQYFSETNYTDNSLYSNQDVDWAGIYAGPLYDLQNIININSDPATASAAALEGSNNNQIAIARILKAYRYSILTDLYGDIPYFEALQGNTQPAFDSQEDIYNDLFKELDEAVDQFEEIGKVKGDILYGSADVVHQVKMWKRFANTLRMILALRVSEVDAALGETQFLAAMAADEGGFASNDDNAVLDYPGGSFNNPWFGIGSDQGVSTLVAGIVNSYGDNRKEAFGLTSSGTLIGVPYGLLREDAIAYVNSTSGWSLILNTPYREQGSPLFVLTYADALMARSQAAFYGWTTENYEDLYYDGLQASWEQWGVYDSDDFDDFTSNPLVTLDGNSGINDENKIALQRWLTFYPNGMQGWSEWRRTGVPALTPTPDAVNTTGQIPVRFPIPSVEYNYNRSAVDAAVARMGSDNDQTKVWWDAN